jgi:predicted PurR-regulated permease PerM
LVKIQGPAEAKQNTSDSKKFAIQLSCMVAKPRPDAASGFGQRTVDWCLVKFFDTKTAQALFTALIFAVVLLFLYAAWRAILAFLFAIFFAYLLAAPVARFQRWFRGSRPAAIAVVYLILIGVLVLVFALLGPPMVQEAQKLAQQVPEWSNQITPEQIAQRLGTKQGWSQTTVDRVEQFLSDHREDMINAGKEFLLGTAHILQNAWWLLLIPILAIFFLKDGGRLVEQIVNSVENVGNRKMVADTIEEMHLMVGHYIRVQVIIALLAMVVITLVLRVMGVPYAIALGPAAGALEFIPVVGPVLGGGAILVVAYFAGFHHVWLLLVFLLVWRGIQDYITSPRLMSGSLELHPLAVLFGVLAGGEVAGVVGVFLSVPVLATLRILWHSWQLYRHSSRPAKVTASP